ncbi:protein kinase domain-containing protein [Ferroacidibacillus organovorans]|uniref:Protein kinase domain-containing protein n=1 Tax=Ferroacidibacillus organovorans TaxID=1765683 RepID=A0A101XRW4_9BACL|nr:phosphotransferase [Ferroacidibacillus organovorans]KUO96412.1 hypothetical protein ATW55_00765 [Ferroacidibacillus organovorans]
MSYKIADATDIPRFAEGTVLTGRFSKRAYRVTCLIGIGANGAVYLVTDDEKQRYALKVSAQASALAVECDRLRTMADISRELHVSPDVVELDDVYFAHAYWPVLVMTYIDGEALDEWIKTKANLQQFPIVLEQLVTMLERLHDAGLAYCDIKPSNFLIEKTSGRLTMIDFGGVTVIGQAVKEFTEPFDRAWWGFGSRKADVHYDLFAVCMLAVHLLRPIPKHDLKRLATAHPRERRAYVANQMSMPGPHLDLLDRLSFVLTNDCTSRDVLRMLQAYLRSTQRTVPSYALAGSTRKSRRRWDSTDYGLLAAVIVFASSLVGILVVSR